jgi:hypothetical protein
MYWIDLVQEVQGSCEHGIETSSSIKCWEVLEYLQKWRLLENGVAACTPFNPKMHNRLRSLPTD